MRATLIIESLEISDRNILLLFEGTKLVGLNFWQGCNDMSLLDRFTTNDPGLFKFVKRKFKNLYFSKSRSYGINIHDMNNIHGSDEYFEILHTIDQLIWDYVNIYMRIDELETEIKKLKELI